MPLFSALDYMHVCKPPNAALIRKIIREEIDAALASADTKLPPIEAALVTDLVCACCGIPWIDGTGFVDTHISPCANHRYGWAYVVSKSVFSEKTARQ
jgi:hypothetical protein